MVDSILRIIDLLINLIDHRKKLSRAQLADTVDPLSADLTLIHTDYIRSLREVMDLLTHPPSALELQAELKKRQEALSPLRAKVRSLAGAIGESEMDEPIKEFARAIEGYFAVASETRSTAFTSLLDLLSEVTGPDGDCPDYPLQVDHIRNEVVHRWSSVTDTYARARLYLLNP